MIGARFGRYPIKRVDFDLIPSAPSFTDDTVLTVVVADAILKGSGFAAALKQYVQKLLEIVDRFNERYKCEYWRSSINGLMKITLAVVNSVVILCLFTNRLQKRSMKE